MSVAPGLIPIFVSPHWSPGSSGRGLGVSSSGQGRLVINCSLDGRSLVVWDWLDSIHTSLH